MPQGPAQSWKTFFKRQTKTKRVKGFYSFLWVFSFILDKFIDLKTQSTTSIIHWILTLLKYFTYVNFYWCSDICSFHFISCPRFFGVSSLPPLDYSISFSCFWILFHESTALTVTEYFAYLLYLFYKIVLWMRLPCAEHLRFHSYVDLRKN